MSDRAELSEVKGFDAYKVTLGDLMRGERATLGKSLLDVQRDLRIKAAYIAAIENSDPSAFSTPGFISGYVRSYARYLGLDPEVTFQKFCDEAGYDGVHPDIGPKSKPASDKTPARRQTGLNSMNTMGGGKAKTGKAANRPKAPKSAAADSLGNQADNFFPVQAGLMPSGEGLIAHVSLSALGSILVLATLIIGLAYGAWAVLQDIQRVEFIPAGDGANSLAEAPVIDPAANDNATSGATARANATEAAKLEQFYRPKELDVPVMTPRDGPIAALDPNRIGALVENNGAAQAEETVKLLAETAPRVTEIAPPRVAVVARRPAWVRITQTDGKVLFEKILDTGESFVLPGAGTVASLRAGNAGAVYLTLDDHAYGPVGSGGAVVKDIALLPGAIVDKFAEVSDPAALDALDNPRVITLNNP